MPRDTDGARAGRPWVWIIVAVLGAGVAVLVTVAGAGIYFVSHHIHAERTSDAEAWNAFDVASTRFRGQRPLYELDSAGRPRLARIAADIPAAPNPAESLSILAWNPDDQRLIDVSLPLWMIGLSHTRMVLSHSDHRFDLRQLNLDEDDLRRIGPALVLDYRDRDGARVLLWTQ
jgi:hypothetical protein